MDASVCALSPSPRSPRPLAMAPKRARTAAASASSSSSSYQSAGAAPKLTLCGGVPHHASLVALWRDERLTDFAVSAEGVEFKAHRVALASCSGYFLNLFESGMRDAADATHALEGISPAVLKALLAFVYEGKCQIDEGQLTEVLEASARLVLALVERARVQFCEESEEVLRTCNFRKASSLVYKGITISVNRS